MLVLCNFLRKLMVSDKKIHRAFRTPTTLSTKPIREIFHFHHLPKLYIGFKPNANGTVSMGTPTRLDVVKRYKIKTEL